MVHHITIYRIDAQGQFVNLQGIWLDQPTRIEQTEDGLKVGDVFITHMQGAQYRFDSIDNKDDKST